MKDPIIVTVYGTPAPQGSKRAFRNQHTGRIQQVESSTKVKPWRQDVAAAAIETISMIELPNAVPPGAWVPLDGPLAVSMVFSFPRPRSHYRSGTNAHLLRPSAPRWPAGRPDLSKLARATEDALTSVLWADDARIVRYIWLAKVYCASGEHDALDYPGAVIRVWPATPDHVPDNPDPASLFQLALLEGT